MRKQDVDALMEARDSLDALTPSGDGDGMALMKAKVLIDQVIDRELRHKAKVDLRDKAKVCFDYERGMWMNVTDAVIDRWKGLFPALCIEVELLRAAGWLLAGKKHRKTDHVAFLQRWFAKDQDRGARDYSPWIDASQSPEEYLQALRQWCKGERDMPKTVQREVERSRLAARGKTGVPQV